MSADTIDMLVLSESGGEQVMGHAQYANSLSTGLRGRADASARFVSLPALEGISQRLTAEVRGLRKYDLDLQQTRWHLVQSARAHKVVRRALAEQAADVVAVNSHSVSMLLNVRPPLRSTLLVADVGVWNWRAMGNWRPVTRQSRRALALSLALERRVLRRASLVQALSGWTKRGLERAAPSANVVELHPGLDLSLLRPAPREPRTRPRVLFVGGRFRLKGGEDLIAALDPMIGSDIDVHLVTPEPVQERPGLRCSKFGPSSQELIEAYQQADLMVLPTHGDAVPWVILEALACGTPVVSTPVGAIPELLDEQRAGLLVKAGASSALRKTIVELLDDDNRRTELAHHGRALCEQRYDACTQTALLLDHLRALPKRRGWGDVKSDVT